MIYSSHSWDLNGPLLSNKWERRQSIIYRELIRPSETPYLTQPLKFLNECPGQSRVFPQVRIQVKEQIAKLKTPSSDSVLTTSCRNQLSLQPPFPLQGMQWAKQWLSPLTLERCLAMNYFPAVFKDVMFDSWTIELFCHEIRGALTSPDQGPWRTLWDKHVL